mmetsp:Transcript_1332/g.4212  ORF Transcript_1332/g.4212 Transcript_1332/m.4212 type:complete len:209 (-) Transcript_1332:237-863(-)
MLRSADPTWSDGCRARRRGRDHRRGWLGCHRAGRVPRAVRHIRPERGQPAGVLRPGPAAMRRAVRDIRPAPPLRARGDRRGAGRGRRGRAGSIDSGGAARGLPEDLMGNKHLRRAGRRSRASGRHQRGEPRPGARFGAHARARGRQCCDLDRRRHAGAPHGGGRWYSSGHRHRGDHAGAGADLPGALRGTCISGAGAGCRGGREERVW